VGGHNVVQVSNNALHERAIMTPQPLPKPTTVQPQQREQNVSRVLFAAESGQDRHVIALVYSEFPELGNPIAALALA